MTIQDLRPMLKPGYVAMNKNGNWMWFSNNPDQSFGCWVASSGQLCCLSIAFDIQPSEWGWENSKFQIN